jgi:hypothetical protein
MTNNDVLLAAAIAGIAAGVNTGNDFSQITSSTQAAAQTAAILAAATEIDSQIAPDTGLSASTTSSVAIAWSVGTTAALSLPQYTKPTLLAQLCAAAFAGRTVNNTTAATYLALAIGVANAYKANVASLPTS